MMRTMGLTVAAFLLAGCGQKGEDGWFVDLYGAVVDEAAAPVPGAALSFATTDGDAVGESTTDADGVWHLPVFGTDLLNQTLTAAVTADGYGDAWATWEVNLRSPETSTLIAGPWSTWQVTDRRLASVRLASDSVPGSATGQLVDASTGLPVAGVALTLQQGWNAPLGTVATAQATTDAAGRFVFEADPPGAYTVLADASGTYAQARFPLFVSGQNLNRVATMSPPVAPGLLRASITWGATPADLDLHLSAPLGNGSAGADGNGHYHVWTGAPAHDPDGTGAEAQMELTDGDGVGPETLAIYTAPGSGTLCLSVFDNTDAADASSTALADADVVLQLWYGEDIPRFYEIDPGEIATLWNPVEIDTDAYVQYAVEEYTVGDAAEDPDAFAP